MSLRSICKWYVCIGIFVIFSIKFLIRPYAPLTDTWQLITDISPNLVGAFLIPFAALWWGKGIFKMNTTVEVLQICLIGFLVILVNEYLQLIEIFGRTFDYLDIIATAPGCYFGYTIFIYKLNKIAVSRNTTI